MISFSKMGSAGGVSQYLAGERTDARAEYYANEHVHSAWGGEGAIKAGITPGAAVTPEKLVEVLEGKLSNPATGEKQQLGRMVNGKLEHRAGLDLTFSAPKSVSIVGLIGNDKRVFAAHEVAVERAMQYLEKQAATRVRTANKGIEYRTTGNLIYAKVQHETSRKMDPQMHTHVAVANATYDDKSGQWRSLEYHSLIRDQKTADSIYKNELALSMKELGYGIQWTKNGPEVAGVSREQIEHFSKRSVDIEAALEKQGTSREEASAMQRGKAALGTRDGKIHVDRQDLVARWRLEAQSVGLDVDRICADAKPKISIDLSAVAERTVQKAIKHLSERAQAFSRNELLGAANELSVGKVSNRNLEMVVNHALSSGNLITKGVDDSGREIVTTPNAILAEQLQIVQIMTNKASVAPICHPTAVEFGIDASNAFSRLKGGYALDSGQREAAKMILTSSDRFNAVQGYAGAGKTSMLKTVKNLARLSGFKVTGMSNGGEQAHKMQKESGIKSSTVASFLSDEKNNAVNTKQLWVCDEASQLGQKDWIALQALAIKTGARIVFIGDKEQHQSVSAGAAFENGQSFMKTATLDKIYRQQDAAGQAAAQDLVHGRLGEAFDKIAAVPGQLIEVRDSVNALEQKHQGRTDAINIKDRREAQAMDSNALAKRVAETYVAERKSTNKSTMIFTATNASRVKINEAVRGELKERGLIERVEQTVTSLSDTKLTDVQKREAWRYEAGMIVEANRKYTGRVKAERGEQFEVIANNERRNTVLMRSKDTGKKVTINPEKRTGFSLYEQHQVGLSVGDDVRFVNKNDKEMKVLNGTKGAVISVTGLTARVRTTDKKVVNLNLAKAVHLQHSYASTTFRDQGNQAKKGIYVIDVMQAGGVGARDAYVGLTRAQKGTIIVTNDAKQARELVKREQNATTAIIEKLQANDRQQSQGIATKQQDTSQKPTAEKTVKHDHRRSMSF